ncbi:hypothetical protein [Arenimonas fontis]|uniref:STAS/SEC14 domain-containing protein n=1 Tax=Arenimonas fontis TaxID=2608255 RepID=A0A5B2ZBE5_9GAMM|nr:hypothetical protein [Arenimonas fontis]KAA2284462.1 hypothetical protein F0415_09050 [Arenimonas fontis]
MQLPPHISLRFEDRPGYLYAEVSGPRDSMQISLAYWAAISARCKAGNARRLMVVERLGDYEGERDMARMIAALVAMGLDRIKIAFVVHRVELLPVMEQGEILAMEYGANGRVFSSADLAERWLRHGGG